MKIPPHFRIHNPVLQLRGKPPVKWVLAGPFDLNFGREWEIYPIIGLAKGNYLVGSTWLLATKLVARQPYYHKFIFVSLAQLLQTIILRVKPHFEATFTKSIFLPLYWLKSRSAPEMSVRGISYKDALVFWAVAIVQVSSKPKNILENIVFYCKGTDALYC